MGCTSDLFEDGLELHELIRGYYKQLLEDLCRIMDYFRVDVLCRTSSGNKKASGSFWKM